MKFHSKSSPLQVVTALLALVTAQGLWAQSGTNNTTTSVTTSTSTSSASAASFTPPPNINAIISKILAGTELSPTNPAPYDNGTRPNAGQGPVNVQAQYRVNRLVTVDPISNSFTLDIFLRLQWNDPRLVFSENLGQESLRLSPSQIWTPDVYFYNEQGAMNQLDATLKIQNDG